MSNNIKIVAIDIECVNEDCTQYKISTMGQRCSGTSCSLVRNEREIYVTSDTLHTILKDLGVTIV